MLLGILAAGPAPTADRTGQTVIADRHHYGRAFEAALSGAGTTLLRPARAGEPPRPGAGPFRPLRQVIESTNDTVRGQLDLEHHGGHRPQDYGHHRRRMNRRRPETPGQYDWRS